MTLTDMLLFSTTTVQVQMGMISISSFAIQVSCEREGVWKWIEEHVSFPASIATRLADFICNQDAGEHIMMKNEENKSRSDISAEGERFA